MTRDNLPSEIFKRWTYLSEDGNGVIAFIAYGSNLHAARGRYGFEIKPDGEFILCDVSQSDRPRQVIGHYDVISPGALKVDLNDQTPRSFTLKIISLQHDILRCKRS